MKNYLVIGNPIDHSLSPKLHNFWIKEHNIDANYYKKQITLKEIESVINEVKNKKIDGINVTVPFKKTILPFLDKLTPVAQETQSVNTIYRENKKIIGHNTDVGGFELGLRYLNYDIKNKTAFILGAGGVVSSIIYVLKKMEIKKILISNRTKKKVEELKKINSDLEIIEWGEISDFDIIINATSLGLKGNDDIKLDFNKFKTGKLFYDIIYNPSKTNFLRKGELAGGIIENGKMMFIYQAHQAFTLWHKVMPIIDEKLIKFLDK